MEEGSETHHSYVRGVAIASAGSTRSKIATEQICRYKFDLCFCFFMCFMKCVVQEFHTTHI